MNDKRRRDVAFQIFKRSARIVCLILIADAIGVAAASIPLGQNLFRDFTGLTLIEVAILFLIGGANDFYGSIVFRKVADHVNQSKKVWNIDEHKRVQEKAAEYVVIAIILLILSFILAYPLNGS